MMMTITNRIISNNNINNPSNLSKLDLNNSNQHNNNNNNHSNNSNNHNSHSHNSLNRNLVNTEEYHHPHLKRSSQCPPGQNPSCHTSSPLHLIQCHQGLFL